jgi:hypothetical protein
MRSLDARRTVMRSRGRGPRLARRQHGPSPQGPPSVRAPRLDRSWPMTADAGARRRGFNGCSCCYRLVNAALSVEVLSGGGPGARRCACSGCVLRGQEWLATCAHLLRCARDSPATAGHGVRHVEGDVGVAMSLRASRSHPSTEVPGCSMQATYGFRQSRLAGMGSARGAVGPAR